MNENDLQKKIADHPRITGSLLSAVGSAFIYWQYYVPLKNSEVGMEVSISAKASFIGVFIFLIGFVYLALGKYAIPIFMPNKLQSKTLSNIVGTIFLSYPSAPIF